MMETSLQNDMGTAPLHTEVQLLAQEHAQASVGMPQLDPSSFASQLFWLVVIFSTFYLLMSRWIAPRIHDVLEKRHSQIAHDLAQSEKLKDEAEKAKSDYEKTLMEAKERATSAIDEAQKAIDTIITDGHAKLDKKLTRQLDESETAIAEQRAQAQESLKPVVAELTAMIVEQLVHYKPAPAKVEKAVEPFLKG